ncbi:MAG: peptidoglycan DD-metalloendopeptidase family protein [Gammaproteobacteria bacterium]
MHKIIHTNEFGEQFASIRPGKTLVVKTSPAGRLEQLTYKKDAVETLVATRQGDQFSVEKKSKEVEHRVAIANKKIHTSLFWDGKEAGLSDKLIMELAEIFAWDIDFALSLREGDSFTVLYEKLFVNDHEIDSGAILAAEFVNQGRTYQAVRYVDKQGNSNYYAPDGGSMRKAFIRTPVDFARISSHFNLHRKHPVLNRIRAHKGVDYAASIGTPVKSTGKGKIIFRGRKGGYGNVVIVQHGSNYSTLYAHLSRFKSGQQLGSRVMQGQVIGYVGKTGLATGPHLHYEFRVNGVHRNPLTVKLPNDPPIEKSLISDFKQQTQPLLVQLAQATSQMIAKNGE